MPVLPALDLAATLPTQLVLTTVHCIHFTALSDQLLVAVEYGADHGCGHDAAATRVLQAA